VNDPLRDYMKKHEPPVTPAPADEWARIQALTRKTQSASGQRVWLFLSAVTLAAASLLFVLNRTAPQREPDAWLDLDEVVYRDHAESQENGAYRDWLWLADHVDDPDH
jgi:hypothetical protein